MKKQPPGYGEAKLRMPQHSLEAESSVLGALLHDGDAWDHVGDLLVEEDFYQSEHRVIFSALGVMRMSGKPVDTITVFEHLEKNGNADAAGGLVYLGELSLFAPGAANARRYAEIVRERSILRKLARVGAEISAASFTADGRAIKEVLDEAEQKVMAIGQANGKTEDGFISLDTVVVGVLDRISELAEDPSKAVGMRTGFADLDRMTSGMQPGDLVIIGGRPSSGKTSLAINIAEHVALNEGLPVAVFSMEMGAGQLGVRMVGSIGRIDQTHLKTGQLSDDEWGRLTEAVEKLRNAKMDINETGGLSVAEVRSGARRMARKHGKLGLVVIDYLQLMSFQTSISSDNRAAAIGDVTKGLKALAKELACPVIVLSQLSRKVEERTDKRPMMSDLRDSGSVEADADTILLIYRDEYYNPNSKEPGIAEVIIGKQRNGPTGTVKLAFISACTKFESLATSYF